MPAVSIIVPVYRCEEYLSPCIDSILAQTFRDFELILVDDGSPDGCGRIIDRYAAKDSRVTAVHTENRGQSAARNEGLERASGTYVYLPDSDDILDPRLLETVLPRFQEGYEMVAFCFRTLPAEKKPDPSLVTVLKKDRKVFLRNEQERYAFLTGPFRMKAVRWEVWNRIIRRDLIERFRIRFPKDRRAYPEDLFFNYCCIAHMRRILMIPDILYTYRLRTGSVSDRLRSDLMIRTSHLVAEELYVHYRNSPDCTYLAEHFLPLYYLLHKGAVRRLRRYHWRQGLTMREARETLRGEIDDLPVFLKRMRQAFRSSVVKRSYRKDRDRLLQLTDRLYTEELLGISAPWAARRFRKFLLSFIRVFRGNKL